MNNEIRKIDLWNQHHSPGSTVTLTDGRVTTTTSIAYQTAWKHDAVIHVHGIAGHISLDRIKQEGVAPLHTLGIESGDIVTLRSGEQVIVRRFDEEEK